MPADTGPLFSTTNADASSVAGQRVGPFELERLLGRGGMAETFVAVRRGPGGFEQRVCLKRILPALANDPNMVRLFLDEARNTASLHHSNIVQVIDFGTADEHHYLALELVEGLDLHRLLGALPDDQGLPAELVVHIAIELSTALGHAHNAPNLAGQRGIFHRDVSPANVLVSDDGDLKLTDFGVAKAAGQARATAAGIVRGKVEYMAPEYGMGGEYDARCDQFSLGVLLFETLAGVRPYAGDSQGEVLHRARQGFHKPLATFRSGAPAQLIETIGRMIRPKPEQRFDSMADVTKALLDIAPGPRGRAALATLVDAVRKGKPIAAPTAANAANAAHAATDAFGQTVISTPHRAVISDRPGATSDRPGQPNAAAIPATPTPRTPATAAPTRNSNTLLFAWIAVGFVVGLLMLFGLRAWLVADEPPTTRIKLPNGIQGSGAGTAADTRPTSGVREGSKELPLGVDPPSLDPSRAPNNAATNTTNNKPSDIPRQDTSAPPPDTQAPREMIHRQSHDLLKPKDW